MGQRHWAHAGWPGNGDAGLVDEVGDGVATLQGPELIHLGTKERERRRGAPRSRRSTTSERHLLARFRIV
jgi:hypothetical protein